MILIRKIPGQVGTQPNAVNVGGVAGIGGALTTAVDRMSFAHDIVMMTDSTLAVGIGHLDSLVFIEIKLNFETKTFLEMDKK